MNAPGKGILKVVSVLYIIFGAIFALLMLLSLFLGSMIGALVGDMLGGFLGTWVGSILFVIFLIPAALDLIFGIIGVKKAGDPSKATFFIVVGIILTVIALIGVVSSFSVWMLLNLVMPVLFIVGGFMNKNATIAPSAPVA